MRSLRIFISHPSHYMTDCEPHGDGLLAQEYIRRLGEREHELHVAVPVMRLQRPMPPSVHLHPIRSWTNVSTAQPSALNRVEYAIRVRSLLNQLRRDRPFDLVHQLNPVVLGMSSLLGGFGLPIVLGPLPAPGALPLPQSRGSRVKQALLHREIRRAAMVLVPNLASLPLIPTDSQSRAKVRELHFGVDTTRFAPEQRGEPADENVLFLANLVKKKGALLLLEAFEMIAAKYPACRLRFAGDGEEKAALKQRAAESSIANRIDFLGRVPRERVAGVLNSATVYSLCSSYEAFGMTALEAMSCGKPVIGTQVGGLGLLVQGTSPKVAAGSREQLAAALDYFLGSSAARQEASAANRHLALEEYEWDRVIDRLEGLYGEVVPSH